MSGIEDSGRIEGLLDRLHQRPLGRVAIGREGLAAGPSEPVFRRQASAVLDDGFVHHRACPARRRLPVRCGAGAEQHGDMHVPVGRMPDEDGASCRDLRGEPSLDARDEGWQVLRGDADVERYRGPCVAVRLRDREAQVPERRRLGLALREDGIVDGKARAGLGQDLGEIVQATGAPRSGLQEERTRASLRTGDGAGLRSGGG